MTPPYSYPTSRRQNVVEPFLSGERKISGSPGIRISPTKPWNTDPVRILLWNADGLLFLSVSTLEVTFVSQDRRYGHNNRVRFSKPYS